MKKGPAQEATRPTPLDTDYWFMNVGEEPGKPHRQWEDSLAYRFLTAGGGQRYITLAKKLRKGDKIFAYLRGHGYVGLAEVTAEAEEFCKFRPAGQSKELPRLPMKSKLDEKRLADPDTTDWCVAVHWIKALRRKDAVLMHLNRRGTLVRIRDDATVDELEKVFLSTQ